MAKPKNRYRKGRMITMSEEEWELLNTLAKASGYSRSGYVRKLLGLEVPAPLPSKDWKACYRELAAIGNNLNQIARMGHITGEIDNEELKKCYQAIIDIRASLLQYTQPISLL